MTERGQEQAGSGSIDTRGDGTGPANRNERPMDRVLLSLARQHSSSLKPAQRRTPGLGLKALVQRFDHLYVSISANVRGSRAGTRAEEWLLDNRHIIEQTIDDIRKDLPPAYLRQLPLVAEAGEAASAIRVQDLARCLSREGAKPLDVGWLEHAVELYQSTVMLTIGELWALPPC